MEVKKKHQDELDSFGAMLTLKTMEFMTLDKATGIMTFRSNTTLLDVAITLRETVLLIEGWEYYDLYKEELAPFKEWVHDGEKAIQDRVK